MTVSWFLSRDWCGLVAALFVAGLGGGVFMAAGGAPASLAPFVAGVGKAILAFAGVLAFGACFQIFMTAWVLKRHPPLGRRVDVGGYKVHLLAEGEGGPAVLWLPGSHDQGLALHHLHERLKSEVRSILYDRPASGRSDTGPFPRDLAKEALELKKALHAAGEKGPFIVAAHSLGGLLAQSFADLYPQEVAGLALLDSACADATIYTQGLGGAPPGAGMGRWFLSAFGLGWVAIFFMRGERRKWLTLYSRAVQPQIVLGVCRPRLVIGFRSALRMLTARPFDMVKGEGALGDAPLVAVIPPATAEEQIKDVRPLLPHFSEAQLKNFIRMRMDAQRQNARLSTAGELRYAPEGAGHGFPFDEPEFTIDEIRRLISRVRTSPAPASAATNERLRNLQDMLKASIATHEVPGASIAVLCDGVVYEAAAGLLNLETGVAATPSSLFHIGSISKLFTATQIMQLAERGVLDIDAPVQRYAPEFSLADKSAAEQITVRHCLAHTSGVPGDFFKDTGPGDDCYEKYARACAALEPVFPAGERFSYCNTGYSLLGRVIENLTGLGWEQALAEMLMHPIGMRFWAARPEDELRFRSAVGHAGEVATGGRRVLPLGPRSMAPGGSRIALTAGELLRFAQMHLDEGRASNGVDILSANFVRNMQSEQIALSFNTRVRAWGLGWMLFDYGGRKVIGHDGGTAGMTAQLRILPEERFAVAVMSNGGAAGGVFRDVAGALLAERGAPLPDSPQPDSALKLDLASYEGCYRRYGMQVDISVEDGALIALVTSRDGEVNVPAPTEFELTPVNRELFLLRMPGGAPMEVYFVDFDKEGRPGYFYSQERALKRLS